MKCQYTAVEIFDVICKHVLPVRKSTRTCTCTLTLALKFITPNDRVWICTDFWLCVKMSSFFNFILKISHKLLIERCSTWVRSAPFRHLQNFDLRRQACDAPPRHRSTPRQQPRRRHARSIVFLNGELWFCSSSRFLTFCCCFRCLSQLSRARSTPSSNIAAAIDFNDKIQSFFAIWNKQRVQTVSVSSSSSEKKCSVQKYLLTPADAESYSSVIF